MRDAWLSTSRRRNAETGLSQMAASFARVCKQQHSEDSDESERGEPCPQHPGQRLSLRDIDAICTRLVRIKRPPALRAAMLGQVLKRVAAGQATHELAPIA